MGEKKKAQKEKAERPLEEKTIKELREEALASGQVHGVHGMNKEELLTALRKVKGIPEPEKKKDAGVRELKAKIGDLRKVRDDKRVEGAPRKELDILRRKISRIKKKTRG